MPKTKLPNSKRIRDAGKDDKLRDFDQQLEHNLMSYEMTATQEKELISKMIDNMIVALPKDIKKMKLYDLMNFVS